MEILKCDLYEKNNKTVFNKKKTRHILMYTFFAIFSHNVSSLEFLKSNVI